MIHFTLPIPTEVLKILTIGKTNYHTLAIGNKMFIMKLMPKLMKKLILSLPLKN